MVSEVFLMSVGLIRAVFLSRHMYDRDACRLPDRVQARCPAKLRSVENSLSAFGSPILLPLTGSTLLGVDSIGSINRGRF
jgi:hypothetical protein